MFQSDFINSELEKTSTVEAGCSYTKGSTVLCLAQNGNQKKHWLCLDSRESLLTCGKQ